MKLFSLLFSFLLLLSLPSLSKAQVYYTSGTFRVIAAETSSIFPGVPGANIQHIAVVTLVFKRNTDFKCDSFWTNGYVSNASVRDTKGNKFSGKAHKGDTLALVFNYLEPTANNNLPPELQSTGSKKENPKVKHTGKLLFRYGFDKLQYYFSIRELKKGENIYAP